MALGTRMRVMILALLVSIGVGSILTYKVLASADVEQRVQQNMTYTNLLLSRYVDEGQKDLLTKVELIGEQAAFKNVLYMADSGKAPSELWNPTLVNSLDWYCERMGIDGMAVVDDKGNFIGSSSVWPEALLDIGRRPWSESVIDGKSWRGLSADGGALHSIVMAPIPLSKQGWNGAFVGVKTIDADEARKIRFGESEIVFLSKTNVLSGSRDFTSEFKMLPGEIQNATSDGREFLGVYGRLPDSNADQQLGFVALQDYAKMTELARRAGTAFVLVLALMTAVGLLLGERFTQSLVKPLDEVVSAAKEMRRGQTPKPFDVGKRRDEVGVLQMVFNDMVTAVEENQKLLLGMIDSDPLTALGNHRWFQEKLRSSIERAKESKQPLSMLLLDIDHFHEFNQVKGHAAGDTQLKAYAGVMRAACPGSALLARYSGDQFIALLPNHSAQEAALVAEAIRTAAKKEPELSTNSIGITVLDPQAANEETFLLSAELALSRAKQLGRNRVSLFESDLDTETPGGSKLMQQYLVDGSLATVQALAAAVDAKDQYTQGHSERVAQLAKDLAEFMGCSPTFVETLYRAGTLHDVGKIGVPDAILSKPNRLTDEEMSVMETHPVLGEVIVGKVPQLAVLLPGVRSHHERWDGKGYPDGLSGEQIPLLARYLSVPDTFDAMTSNRPYRTALSVEIALNEIEKCAGTQFEPELAIAFVRMMRQRAAIPATAGTNS